MFTTKSNQKNKTIVRNLEGLEALKELPNTTAKVVKEEVAQMAKDAWSQILPLEQEVQNLSGELRAGESLDLSNVNKQPQREPEAPQPDRYVQPGIDYLREFRTVRERPIVTEDTRQIQGRIEQIIVELRKLTSRSSELAVQFEKVTMEETPREPGTYHLNFFEWVFSVIQKARERIEESQTWLATFKSKKRERGYWNMFKKHGTTFGLSSERVVSTQTG